MVVLLYWPSVEKKGKRSYNWVTVDRQVRAAANAGIRPMLRFWGNPYARRDTVTPMASKRSRKSFVRMVRAAANRYGQGGKFWKGRGRRMPVGEWQLLNEPNSFTFYRPRPNPRQYGRLVKMTGKALRSSDRKAKLVLGGMFGTEKKRKRMTQPADFLRKMYKVKGVKRHFSGFALHPYAPNLREVKLQINRARRAAKRAGDRKVGLYITEIGWSSAAPAQLDHPQAKGEQGQAAMMRNAFNLFVKKRKAWRIKKVIWYALQDRPRSAGDPCTWCEQAGLFRVDGRGKPALEVFKSFARGR